MRKTVFLAIAVVGVCILALVFADNAHAVVGDVTLTGLPPETSISLTNEKTGEKEERKTDDKGVVVIPLGGRNWDRGGHYTVTARNPSLFPGTPSRKIELTDGPNRKDLTGLVPFISGYVPRGNYHVFDFHVGARFFDIPEIGTSLGLRADYSPPISFWEDVFTLRPYGSVWGVPSVRIASRKPFDFHGTHQERIDSGTMVGINVGVKHVSDMRRWGLSANDANIVGILMAGVGWVHYDFDMKRVEDIKPHFKDVHNFNSSDNAFRMEFNTGLAINKDNYFIGLKGGVAPTVTDIFNGGNKLRWEGNISLVGGWRCLGWPF
jgi:hypothetical protein